MSQRMDYNAASPAGMKALGVVYGYVRQSGLPSRLVDLVFLRVSQINGCAYCIDMHHKDARAAGETEERLYMLSAWREATVYSAAERAALALTESITLIAQDHVPPDVEAEARAQFDEETYAALVFTIATINVWNRLAITSHAQPGRYVARAATGTS